MNIFSGMRAFLRRTLGIKGYFELGKIRPPILICFDHIYSEYLTIKSRVADLLDDSAKEFIESLPAKRTEGILPWSDIYHFQLILTDVLPPEQLRTKIRRLRFDYRSVAGEKEFDDYMSSKPPDLQSPPQPGSDQSAGHYDIMLRDDLRDLLGRMYLEYAILPIREERLTDLTWVAARLCLFSLLVLLGILAILFFIPLFQEMYETQGSLFDKFNALGTSAKLSSLTVFVVVVSGAMGGFVSALQRIQSPPGEGDSLYNLLLLFHGSYSIFVAPISGAIFAIVLYLLFTSGTLMGSFFPTIFTPVGKFTKVSTEIAAIEETTKLVAPPTILPATQTPSPTPVITSKLTTENGPTTSPPAAASPSSSPAPSPTSSPVLTATPKTTPTSQSGVKPEPVPEQGINVFDFLARSGPGSGKDYALLIVWCFIAGFAERFVPDALDRLIAHGKGRAAK